MPRPKNIISAGSTAEAGASVSEIHTYSTSTLYTKIRDETAAVRGGTSYNPDFDPWQNPILKRKYVSTENPLIREMLEERSEFIEKHTRKELWKIVENGWQYSNGTKVEDWSPQLQEAFVDVMSKALVIDSAFITLWKDGLFRIFTSNDVHIPYGNDDRQITEVYFHYPALMLLRHDFNEQVYNSAPVGFLTQYTEDEERVERIVTNRYVASAPQVNGRKIFKQCVVVTPKPSVHKLYGKVFLAKQNEIALAKVHLSFYAMLKAYKGGVNRAVAFNEGSSKSMVKGPIIKEMKRGMMSRGIAYHTKGKEPVGNMFDITETEIPDLGFETTNKLITEESKLSQQAITGAPESGSLGGNAAEIMEKSDEEYKLEILVICEKVIQDINEVFFNVPKQTMSDDGVMLPEYRVEFYDPVVEQKEEREEKKKISEENKGIEEEKAGAQQEFKERELALRQSKFEFDKSKQSKKEANTIEYFGEAHSVASTDADYLTYRGNMFAPGLYRYPERLTDREIIYTSQEIEDYTNRPITSGYIELSHSFDQKNVVFDGNIGFFDTQGFSNQQDDTLFHIRKDADAELRKLGIIQDNKLKVSPYFNRRQNAKTGRKELHVWNCAVVDPRKERSRAEMSGLDTSAQQL